MKSKVKALYTISILLTILSLIVPLAALPFLPDVIPAHYNFAGMVDRWGSRYETLIFPAFIVPLSVVWIACGRSLWHGQAEKASELIWMIAGVVQLLVFSALQLYFLYTSFRQVANLSTLSVDLNRFLCIVSAVGFMAMGNYLPKLQKPGPTGLHTPWSMKNEAVWRRSQRFGGRAMVAAGAVSIAAALFAGGVWCWLWLALSVTAAVLPGRPIPTASPKLNPTQIDTAYIPKEAHQMLLILHLATAALFILLGIVFLRGKGSFLIAGHNTLPPEEKAKIDEKKLTRFMGKFMFALLLHQVRN